MYSLIVIQFKIIYLITIKMLHFDYSFIKY